ncbi:hypothetical protein MILUP08_42195 [Micromonospora lupini str. Lupac 08]|uniref:Uncharacterized protein n=1 Tax=Micromonospora lupini str. Lupac 08 TaxID=1150864 RepID=I0L0C8_9ACTN|nr:hypothetical protein MILUP08_42195 [Micromonospora lupini str. Lupac 08]
MARGFTPDLLWVPGSLITIERVGAASHPAIGYRTGRDDSTGRDSPCQAVSTCVNVVRRDNFCAYCR